jgi:D-sedoheptulose 7-phosphate isomerase
MTFIEEKIMQQYLGRVTSSVEKVSVGVIDESINVINNVSENGNSIWIAGNGGSAATASHFATDLSRCFNKNSKPIKSISLSDNSGLITAIANDFSFSEIFSKQITHLASPGDLFITLSASGNSSNIINGLKLAKANGLISMSLTGFDGGLAHKISDYSIHTPTSMGDYGVAEDSHSIICHYISSIFRSYTR